MARGGNPYHDDKGRFTDGPSSGGTGGMHPGAAREAKSTGKVRAQMRIRESKESIYHTERDLSGPGTLKEGAQERYLQKQVDRIDREMGTARREDDVRALVELQAEKDHIKEHLGKLKDKKSLASIEKESPKEKRHNDRIRKMEAKYGKNRANWKF